MTGKTPHAHRCPVSGPGSDAVVRQVIVGHRLISLWLIDDVYAFEKVEPRVVAQDDTLRFMKVDIQIIIIVET